MRLEATGVSWASAAGTIIDRIDLAAASGEFVGLIGPNGSGKSTLLRTIYRVLQPHAGRICFDEADVWQTPAAAVARRAAVVTQEHPGAFELSVLDVVMMGRTPHKGPFERDTQADAALAQEALGRVGMQSCAVRRFHTLSGGEKQRVLVARALTQQPRLLVLDEPTNHLDIRFQIAILELVRGLNITAVAALHDLNLAARYCDRLYMLHGGRVVASGAPAAVLTPALIAEVYGVRAEVELRPSGQPQIVFTALL